MQKIKPKNQWGFALLLTIPVFLFIAGYYFKAPPNHNSPGFLLHDNVSYIAFAREQVDHGGLSLSYSNPYNDSENYPRIYVHVQNFFYLLLLRIGISPGIMMLFSTLLFSVIFFRILISLHDHVLPSSKNRVLTIVLFSWGGGLLALGGLLAHQFTNIQGFDKWDKLFILDPGWGWWGLNLGRSLLFSAEAYYHVLFFGGILSILKKRWVLSIFCSLMLVLSHPFTGIEYLLIIALWSFVEIIIKKSIIPWWHFLAICILVIVHLIYYLIFLNQYPEHLSIQEQYSLNWRLRYYNMIPAYILVGGLAIINFLRWKGIEMFSGQNRLFICWFLVAFTLSNHEMFMKPMQPVHFTRGYIWSSLFLLGLPALDHILSYLKKASNNLVPLYLFIAVFLSDNFAWITNYWRKENKTHLSVYVRKEDTDIIEWLKKNTDNNTLLLSSNNTITYLATAYTRAYSWTSHMFTTPFYSDKVRAYNEFISNKEIHPLWYRRKLIFIFDNNNTGDQKRSNDLPFTPLTSIKIHQYTIVSTYLK